MSLCRRLYLLCSDIPLVTQPTQSYSTFFNSFNKTTKFSSWLHWQNVLPKLQLKFVLFSENTHFFAMLSVYTGLRKWVCSLLG